MVVASDRKVVRISPTNGQELARLDHNSWLDLPAEGLIWASAKVSGSHALRVATITGLCLESELGENFQPLTLQHRAQGSVLSYAFSPLTLRLGGQGFFAIERNNDGLALIPDSQERRLWRIGLTGTVQPWMKIVGDRVAVIDEQNLRFVTQEGEIAVIIPLLAKRTGDVVELGSDQVVFPTVGGVISLQNLASVKPQQRVLALDRQPIGPLVIAGDRMTVVSGQRVTAFHLGDTGAVKLWEQVCDAGEHMQHLWLGPNLVTIADDAGNVRLCRWQDGDVLQTIRCGAPLMTAPLVVNGMMLVVVAPGILRGYAVR